MFVLPVVVTRMRSARDTVVSKSSLFPQLIMHEEAISSKRKTTLTTRFMLGTRQVAAKNDDEAANTAIKTVGDEQQ